MTAFLHCAASATCWFKGWQSTNKRHLENDQYSTDLCRQLYSTRIFFLSKYIIRQVYLVKISKHLQMQIKPKTAHSTQTFFNCWLEWKNYI